MVDAQTYYRDGFAEVDFDASALCEVGADAMALTTGASYSWVQKYQGTRDLRPSVIGFDPRVVQCLFDAGIPAIIEDATCSSDLVLIHCQLRHVTEQDREYMSWHRDTYLSATGKWVGNTPPVHKLIVYIDDGTHAPRLQVVRRSHRRMYDSHDMDVGRYAGSNASIATIHASNSRALLFNTAFLHNTVPEADARGSLRYVYSFATRRQYEDVYASDEVHRLAYDSYTRCRGNV